MSFLWGSNMRLQIIYLVATILLAFFSSLALAVKGFDQDISIFAETIIDAYDFYFNAILTLLHVYGIHNWLRSVFPQLPALEPHWKHVFALLWIFFAQYGREVSMPGSVRRLVILIFGGICALFSGWAAGLGGYYSPEVLYWAVAGIALFSTAVYFLDIFTNKRRTHAWTLVIILGILFLAVYAALNRTFSLVTFDLTCITKNPSLTLLLIGGLGAAAFLTIFGLPEQSESTASKLTKIVTNPGRRLGVAILSLFGSVAATLTLLPRDEERWIAATTQRNVEMVRIDGVPSFASADDHGNLEHPAPVQTFWLSRTEVTNKQFAEFVRETKRTPTWSKCSWDPLTDPNLQNHPAGCINWPDANAYARWLSKKTGQSYRLPTKAEWQYAAVQYDTKKRTTSFRLPWNDNDDLGCSYGNFDGISCDREGYSSGPAPVGSSLQFGSPTNVFGLLDMFGNGFEWTEELSAQKPAQVLMSSWRGGVCSLRAMRGGSWFTHPNLAMYGVGHGSSFGGEPSGFRLARTD